MTPAPDLSSLTAAEKDALIATLLARVEALAERVAALEAENAALKAENAALREKLNLPPKTPDNSSKPPSQGTKPQGERQAKPKGKVHAGAHRPLHPNPTRRRDVFVDRCPHCDAAVTAVPQLPLQAYDRIEIPVITPDVTRVTLFGGVCPCCHERFKATAPTDLPPGSPYGPNLRAFVLYLRFAQAIPFERLACSTCSGLRSAKAHWPTCCTTAHRYSKRKSAPFAAVCCPARCCNPMKHRRGSASGPSG